MGKRNVDEYTKNVIPKFRLAQQKSSKLHLRQLRTCTLVYQKKLKQMKTERILKIMKFFSWFAFIGLTIKAAGILITYLLSIENAEASKNLYEGLNMYAYRNYSFTQYSLIISYKVLLFASEAYIAYLVIQLLKKLNIKQPFNIDVQKLMQQISNGIFYIWILAIVHNTHTQLIGKRQGFEMDLISSDFVFLSVIIFIFAQIVKRGIEIQSENDLTI